MSKFQATAYMRLSYTDDKDNQSDSITNQKNMILDFLKNNPDIELVSEKIDDGYSGIVFNRPAFKEMMQDITEEKVNCVIVKDLSRLGREYIETGNYIQRIFPAYGVRFIAINDNVDTAKENSADDLVVSIKSIMNDSYCRDISVKTRSALTAKRKNGDFVGACPIYGYRKSDDNKNLLVPDEYASRVVQDIFKMKLDGASASKISESLNSACILSPIAYKKNKGLPHPTGGYADKENAKWSATTIIRILKDETYTGVLIQGKQSTPNYKLKSLKTKPKDEWVRIENAHTSIIDKKDFDIVQKIIRVDTRTAPHDSKVYLFSGLLICEHCGSRMVRKTNRYKGKEYYYYYCPTGKKKGCTSSDMVKESELINCTLDCIKGYIDNIISLDEVINSVSVRRINQELLKKYNEQLRENEIQLNKCKEIRAGLYENFVNGVISKEEHKMLKDKFSGDYERLSESIATLKQQIEDTVNNKDEKIKWIEHFKQYSSITELDRKAVINLIQKIRITDKHTIEVTFNYELELMSVWKQLSEINYKEAV